MCWIYGFLGLRNEKMQKTAKYCPDATHESSVDASYTFEDHDYEMLACRSGWTPFGLCIEAGDDLAKEARYANVNW